MNIAAVVKPQFLFRPQQIFLRLARALYQKRIRLADVNLPWGLTIRINPHEVIGRAIWHHGLYDLAVSEALWRLLDPGAVALDIGANIGYTTRLMARKAGATGKVLAFEPHPELFRALESNVAGFKRRDTISAVTVLNLALSNQPGAGFLASTEQFQTNQGVAQLTDNPAAGADLIVVQKTSLDAILGAADIALMKIDVEGHELQVLQGARNLLQRQGVKHIIYEDLNGNASAVHSLLAGYGYTLYALGWNFWKPVISPMIEGPRIHAAYEAPNYLATIDSPAVLARFQGWGWQVLA
jgi:FkbM family methyltransferase